MSLPLYTDWATGGPQKMALKSHKWELWDNKQTIVLEIFSKPSDLCIVILNMTTAPESSPAVSPVRTVGSRLSARTRGLPHTGSGSPSVAAARLGPGRRAGSS